MWALQYPGCQHKQINQVDNQESCIGVETYHWANGPNRHLWAILLSSYKYTLFSSAPGMFFRVHNVLGHKSGSPRGDQLMPKFLVGQQCLWCLAGPWCYALWEMFMMAEEFIGLGVICRWLLNSTWMWNFLTQTSPRWFWPSRFLSIGDANKSLIIRILYVNCASFSV